MTNRTILITGANRGIGFSIAQALSQRSSNLTIILTSRVHAKAQEAINQLENLGLKGNFHPLELDVTNDESISKAVQEVSESYGHLDVLINNAGLAPNSPSPNSRTSWSTVLDTNLTSPSLLSISFLPLLQTSPNNNPKVLNISSARGSFSLVTSGANPPTEKIAYSVSKAGLNLLTIEMFHAYPEIEWQVCSPGWCKTAFNGWKGTKDPLEGAEVVVRLALAEKGVYGNGGFWQFENGRMEEVPW